VIAGGGNVSNSGTPAVDQIALWTNPTTIKGSASWNNAQLTGAPKMGDMSLGYLQLTYSAPFINISVGGSDPNVYVQLTSKGSGGISLYTGNFGAQQVGVEPFASGGVYIGLHGGVGQAANIHLSDNSPIGIYNASLGANGNATTQTAGDNSTLVATTAFVQAAVAAALAAQYSTGDLKPTHKTAADAGWILWRNGTIGNAGSGSTLYANAAAQALFTLYYNSYSDANCPLQTSTGAATTRAVQGTAAAAWAALCRMTLPLSEGRALGIAGTGVGLTTRTLGSAVGAETVTQTASTMVSHTHGASGAVTNFMGLANVAQNNWDPAGGAHLASCGVDYAGGSQPMNIMNPTTYINVMIKL
jgi:hypothetical protein